MRKKQAELTAKHLQDNNKIKGFFWSVDRLLIECKHCDIKQSMAISYYIDNTKWTCKQCNMVND